MKHSLMILASLMLGLALFAQDPGQDGGAPPSGEGGGAPPSGEGRPPMMKYDASKEVTLTGTVSAVQSTTRGPGKFVTLTFLASSTTYTVMVGPEFVLTKAGVTLAQGDALTIVGVAQGAMFTARTITKGDTVLTLLDATGRPAGRP